ncbi:hypothetical protein [Wolbachia endosymbiont (group B) of Anania hortulata]
MFANFNVVILYFYVHLYLWVIVSNSNALEVNLQHTETQPEIASQQIRTQAETNSQKMDELIPDNQMLPKENVELKQEIEAETIVKLERQCSNLNDELEEERLKFDIEEPENEYE